MPPGDVVIVEPALCWAALPEAWTTHCYHCCRRLEAALPCSGCSSVLFCSEPCRSAAAAHHASECGLLDRLVALDVGPMALLALRLVSAAGPDRLRQQRLASARTSTPADPLDAACGLVGHTGRRSVADLFRRAATAVCLAHLLQSGLAGAQSGPLADAEDRPQNGPRTEAETGPQHGPRTEVETGPQYGPRTEAETGPEVGPHEPAPLEETAAGLLQYLQSLPCNAHEVSEQVRRGSETELREVGAAVYPTVSLLNHACDPNVLRVSHGTACVVRVIRPVPAGGELLDNYGFHWAVQSWMQRQEALKRQYHFDCHCQACVEDWGRHEELPEKEYFRCEVCDAPPVYCYHEKSAEKVKEFNSSRRVFLKAVDRRGRDGAAEDVTPLVRHLSVMDRVISRPSREFNNCQEAIKLSFFAKGNCYQESVKSEAKVKLASDSGATETYNCIERLYGKNMRISA